MVSEDTEQRVTKKMCLACNREFTGIIAACPHDGTVLIPLQQDQLVGTKLADRYHIQSVIGHGGMGVVYKAKHELMDRTVAIKMLLSQLISDSMSVKRFQQEAKAASRLKHPNVITLYDFGVSPNGQPYLVMDYLQGISLADVIKKEGQVSTDRCIKIFKQACNALNHAHQQGVIHRDLKPGNIMLVEDEDDKDFVKVVDFGVAKLMVGEDENQRLTQTGEVCGSPVYMSPEQCMGQKLDARSDIYTMGVVLYEALTGRLPLLGKTMVETMSKHISEMPQPFHQVRPDLYIPERLEAVVFRAMAKDPENRHQTMEDMEQDLDFAVPRPGKSPGLRTGTLPSQTTTKMTAAVEAKKSAMSPAVIAVVAVAILAAAGAIAFMLMNKPQPAQAPPPVSAPQPKPPQAKPAARPPQAATKSEDVETQPKATAKPKAAPVRQEAASEPVRAPEPPAVRRRAGTTSTYAAPARSRRTAPAAAPNPYLSMPVSQPSQPPADRFEMLKRERSY